MPKANVMTDPLLPSELPSIADENDAWAAKDMVDKADGNNTRGGWTSQRAEQTENTSAGRYCWGDAKSDEPVASSGW